MGLLLRYPALAVETDGNGALPFVDATAAALARTWQERIAGRTGDGQPVDAAAVDLEGFLTGLDIASADLARGVLARMAAGGEQERLDADRAREVLRVTLLRLRIGRLEEDLRDGRLLLEEAQREGDRARLEDIEQQITRLGREKDEATKAMQEPAEAAGTRRS